MVTAGIYLLMAKSIADIRTASPDNQTFCPNFLQTKNLR